MGVQGRKEDVSKLNQCPGFEDRGVVQGFSGGSSRRHRLNCMVTMYLWGREVDTHIQLGHQAA